MSNGIQVTTNIGWYGERFERYLARSIQISRVSVQQVVTRQAKGLVRNAFRYTPPMKGRTFAKGYSAAVRAIRNTLKRATKIKNEEPLRKSLARARTQRTRDRLEEVLREIRIPAASLASKIKANLTPEKHYPDGAERFYATTQTRKNVQALFERTIGVTAAGWCFAANRLGVLYEPWVGRFQGKNSGTASFRVTGTVVEFRAVNPNRHTDSATIQRALNSAYDRQATAMRNSLIRAIQRGVLRREDVFAR